MLNCPSTAQALSNHGQNARKCSTPPMCNIWWSGAYWPCVAIPTSEWRALTKQRMSGKSESGACQRWHGVDATGVVVRCEQWDRLCSQTCAPPPPAPLPPITDLDPQKQVKQTTWHWTPGVLHGKQHQKVFHSGYYSGKRNGRYQATVCSIVWWYLVWTCAHPPNSRITCVQISENHCELGVHCHIAK